MNDADVNEKLIYKKEPYKKCSFKCFIESNDNNIRTLCIKLTQMIGYAKIFDSNETMSLMFCGYW